MLQNLTPQQRNDLRRAYGAALSLEEAMDQAEGLGGQSPSENLDLDFDTVGAIIQQYLFLYNACASTGAFNGAGHRPSAPLGDQ